MDLHKMIAELATERDRLDEAILALERLSASKARRRGRPPSWLKNEIEHQNNEENAELEASPSIGRRIKPHSEKGVQEKEKDTA